MIRYWGLALAVTSSISCHPNTDTDSVVNWWAIALKGSLSYPNFVTNSIILKGSNHHLSFVVLDYTLEDYTRCTQAGLKAGANIYGVYVSLGVQGGSCNGLLNEMGGEVSCFTKCPAEYVPFHQVRHELMLTVVLSLPRRHKGWQHGGGLCCCCKWWE